MTQSHDEPVKSEWELYLAQKALAVDAAHRARLTHRDRRAQESSAQRTHRAALLDQKIELVRTRRDRAMDLELERRDNEARGVDPDTERRTLAKVRRDAAALVRDQGLLTIETNRPAAITYMAQQAVETRQEHNSELTAANDSRSPEYRATIEVRIDAAARLKEYRAERDVEQSKLQGEQRSAAALMALQARETRLLREMGDVELPVSVLLNPPKLQALAALISEVNDSAEPKESASQKKTRIRRTSEESEMRIDELRRTLAANRKKAAAPDQDESSDVSDQSSGQGMFRMMFKRVRRGA